MRPSVPRKILDQSPVCSFDCAFRRHKRGADRRDIRLFPVQSKLVLRNATGAAKLHGRERPAQRFQRLDAAHQFRRKEFHQIIASRHHLKNFSRGAHSRQIRHGGFKPCGKQIRCETRGNGEHRARLIPVNNIRRPDDSPDANDTLRHFVTNGSDTVQRLRRPEHDLDHIETSGAQSSSQIWRLRGVIDRYDRNDTDIRNGGKKCIFGEKIQHIQPPHRSRFGTRRVSEGKIGAQVISG